MSGNRQDGEVSGCIGAGDRAGNQAGERPAFFMPGDLPVGKSATRLKQGILTP